MRELAFVEEKFEYVPVQLNINQNSLETIFMIFSS